jgi:COP9 signalosome complex subunit 3
LAHLSILSSLEQHSAQPWYIRSVQVLVSNGSSGVLWNHYRLLSEILQWVTNLCIARGNSKSMILCLKRAVRISENDGQNRITPIHPLFLQVCLVNGCYNAAQSLVSMPVIVLPESPLITLPNILTYLYYAGLIHIGLRNFPAAIHDFELALSLPSRALTSVHVLIWEKLILCHGCRIHSGNETGLLKERSTPMRVEWVRDLRLHSPVFAFIESAIKEDNPIEFAKLANQHAEMLQNAHNWGLMQEVAAALLKRRILRLSSTYTTLPLDLIASSTSDGISHPEIPQFSCLQPLGPDEALSTVMELVESGAVAALIDDASKMVTFKEVERLDSVVVIQALRQKMSELMVWRQLLQKEDEELVTSKEYIKKQMTKGRRNNTNGARSGGGGSFFSSVSSMEMDGPPVGSGIEVEMDDDM